MATSRPGLVAETALQGFQEYRRRFTELTRRAPGRFLNREWELAAADARERILLYGDVLDRTLGRIARLLPGPPDPRNGRRAKEIFASSVAGRGDVELAETFFNSVIRRLHGTVGVNRELEFVGRELDVPRATDDRSLGRCHSLADGFRALLETVLNDLPLEGEWAERPERIDRAVRRMVRALGPEEEWTGGFADVLSPVFFRNKAAYVVGRVRRDDREAPLVLCFLNPPGGLTLDAILLTPDEASVVFGFTRSYMHVDWSDTRPLVEFLASIMPHKRVDEIYTSVGFNRHGKTELFRALEEHLHLEGGCFEPAPGKPGLVMSVFTLPGLEVVFKVIRDHFGHPKKTTRNRVMRKYELIFVRDRVGRLADAQTFEQLDLPGSCFSDRVLDELLSEASRTVRVQDGRVHIRHLYTERRVRPLDLYLDEAPPEEARRAAVDFGWAIRDLAAADIFPGDMLVKNFGVTRHGRVVFYDYDEVQLLSTCRFRKVPPPPYPGAELEPDPYFYVGPDDVFPAEWRNLLGPSGPPGEAFREAHAVLFDPAWWQDMQDRQRRGEMVDFFPYPQDRRLEE